LARKQAQDFISPHRIPRWGTVGNRHQIKNFFAAGEDIEFELTADSPAVAPGDLTTLFDDSQLVLHPVNGESLGYYVRILGHLEVKSVSANLGVGRLVETYYVVEKGAGVMGFQKPVLDLPVRSARVDVEGVILRGKGQLTFATEQVVFLDRGSSHGLDPGVLVDVPVREGERAAQGVVDLKTPLARVLVVAVRDKTSTGVIVDSRAAVEAGDRFVAATQP
jgi:hypothetical protein